MIVRHFDVGRPLKCPPEADSELVVDPDRVLPLTISLDRLETIAGRLTQVTKIGSGAELAKLAARYLDQIRREALWTFAAEHVSVTRSLKLRIISECII